MRSGKAEIHYGPQPTLPACPPLTIVADDLTGACDAAVAFTCRCNPVRVQISRQATENAGLRAISTESRDLFSEEAVRRLQNIVERLPAGVELFKKVDSVFRGNTVVEIAAALRHAPCDIAIIAPAYPALGRVVHQGVLKIHDSMGTHSVPIADLLAQAGCSLGSLAANESFESLADSLTDCVSIGTRAVLCDASTSTHLTQIVRAARSLGKQIVWIGSGGLAHALAAELPTLATQPPKQLREGPTIFFTGSPHPVSRAQVSHLQQVAQIAEHPSPATHSTQDDLLVPIELGRTTANEIRRAVSSYDPAQIGCLFMTGGDTAHFACRALEIQSLRLLHEFAPGVPVALAEGGPFDGVRIVLKSGGFGAPDLLCRLLEANRASHEVTA
ncbi:MAG TPA: four-carbon acid sugar kinase family protein [Acidobacteriaceae bacterium]|nr:four-carbon acid sugar kinase family protein [Acidobacteriaceae bacterium]